MSEALELTSAQRAAGVDRIGESLALLSGAGCGKTFVLARRFTELLRAGEPDPGEAMARLVALTFTEKAALEMSQRVRSMLTSQAEAATGPMRNRLLRWIDELPEARISTIHGFCSALLRSRAVEAGVDPNFAVCADSLLAGRLAAEAADRALLEAVEDQREDAAGLLESYTFDRVVKAVTVLLDRRTAVAPDDYADGQRIVERWGRQVSLLRDEAWRRMDDDAPLRRMLDELAGFHCSDDADRLLPLRDELLDAAGWILADRAERTVESFARVCDVRAGNCGSDRNWGGERGSAKCVRDAMKDLARAIGAYALHAEDLGEQDRRAAGSLASLVRLAGEAGAIYTAEKRARGLLDFTDLLEQADRLLRTRPGVRKALAGRIGQLLIDECQDTDAFQTSLLGELVFGSGAEAPLRPPAGRLFIVGDAMQSIYRFRGAQVEVFSEMCARMGPGNTERLGVSFRTHGAGVAFVNELFGKVMGDDYSPIEAHRTACPDGPSVEILLAGSDGPISHAPEATAAQAAVTAQRIGDMIDNSERIVWDRHAEQWRPVRAGDVAILFARMTNSLEYERQLQRRGVPYYVVAGSGFFRRQEVLDVLNALAVVDNAFDDVAFVGVLRSSLFGLDDNSLMHLAEAVDPPYLPALAAAEADGQLDDMLGEPMGQWPLDVLKDAVALLERLRKLKDAVGVEGIIERLLAATGYEATLLAQPQGKRMLGNVRLLLERARAAGEQGTAPADFLTQMKELVLHEARYEQAPVAGEAENVVRIMTIHKAKGLEFPVVVIPDLNAAVRTPRDDLLIRSDWGVTWRPAGRNGDEDQQPSEEPLSARLAWAMEDHDRRAEDVRKWYVAVTRHQDHLVLIGADWRGSKGRFRNGNCFLAQMDEHLHIAEAADDGRQTIAYADGRYAAAVRRCAAALPQAESLCHRPAGPGWRMLAAASGASDLSRAIIKAGRQRTAAPPLVGPLGAAAGAVTVAVSTLGEFERCEMYYHWRQELRVPAVGPGRPGDQAPHAAPIDPATLGTLYHRCMELLDVARPQPAERLVAQAAGEMDLLETPGLDVVAREFEGMLAGFGEHELSGVLAGARADLRELDFEMQLGPALLRGQIDLLFQDADGRWHIVDYKSDRVGAEGPASHARRYELQMLTYALAATRHLGEPPADAMLYFLRTSAVCCIDCGGEAIARGEQRIADIAGRLIAARRTGQYQRCDQSHCPTCPYLPFCRP